jgi:hypothetical protein
MIEAVQTNDRQLQSDTHWNSDGELEVLTFDLHGETFALEATMVRKFSTCCRRPMVPGAMAFVGSVINFRGKVIPLADLRLAFGMEAAETTIDSRIIVIELDLTASRRWSACAQTRSTKSPRLPRHPARRRPASACAGAGLHQLPGQAGGTTRSRTCRHGVQHHDRRTLKATDHRKRHAPTLIANGDLTVQPASRCRTRTRWVLALQSMVERLRGVVADALSASDNVSAGSQELSASSEQVSQGATEQAASAEEASASMEEMAANIKQNADNAAQTEKIARQSSKDAEASGEAVNPRRRRHADDRREDRHRPGNRPSDRPAGPERRRRSRPRRRARQGLRGRRLGSPQAGRTQPDRRRRDRRGVGDTVKAAPKPATC